MITCHHRPPGPIVHTRAPTSKEVTETFHPTNIEMTMEGGEPAFIGGPDQDLIAELLLDREVGVRTVSLEHPVK